MIEFGKMSPNDRPESRAFFAKHGFPIEQFSPVGMRPAWMGTSMYGPVTQPDKFIDDHDVIKIGDREFEVILDAGAFTGSQCDLFTQRKGDDCRRSPVAQNYATRRNLSRCGGHQSARRLYRSQLKVQKFDVELVLPAHGGVYHDHRHRANQFIEHHRYREAEMLDLTREKRRRQRSKLRNKFSAAKKDRYFT